MNVPWLLADRTQLQSPEGAAHSTWSIGRRDIELGAGTLGEVGRAIQMLPGVTSIPGVYSAFYLRGGAPSETVVQLEGRVWRGAG